MKEGFDKEIDSLLRRRARGAVKSFADGDGARAAPSAHLDADELGAFAEGALPSPARLAAASHLADCDRCRGVAVALSRALGGGAEVKQVAAVPASTATKRPAAWRAWAATLFAPRVLRFAAPVLALSVVAVVSFVALRTRNGAALNETVRAPRPAEVSDAQPSAGVASTATANANQSGLVAQNQENLSGNSNAAARQQPPEGRGPSVAGEPQPAPVGEVAGVGAGGGAPATDAAAPPAPPAAVAASPEESREIAKAAPRPVGVEESEQPSKSEKSDSKDKSARDADDEVAANDLAANQRSRAAQNRAGEVQMPDGGARNQKRADSNVSNVYRGNTGSSAAPKEAEREDRAAAPSRRARSSTRAENKVSDEVGRGGGETREAAGHRFRREGSAWIDVKYKPSMRSTGVRRGSEAFRALVADVPVVGRVAEQISGEVIIVVKSHAYRIH